jgi:hypothetical protein
MEEINRTELILSLISDNLVNLKLVNGLNELGLIADDYELDLGNTIFKLMGFKASANTDEIFNKVLIGNSRKVEWINITSKQELRELSKEIYRELLFTKDSYEPES